MAKIFIAVLSFFTFTTIFASNEWYCKKEVGKFEICRRCISLSDDCENSPSQCKCENLKFAKNTIIRKPEIYGGPEQCQTDDPFCYVSKNSKCKDKQYSTKNELIQNIWFNSDIYYSYKACNARKQDDKVGNEKVLKGVKIKRDYLKDENSKVWKIQLDPDADYTSCQETCESIKPQCGAWSFDTSNSNCYLHSVISCCGQFGKRQINPEWISGYSCNKCWSTKRRTDCPCSEEDRLTTVPQRGAGGVLPLHATSSGTLKVLIVKVAVNKCKCVLKKSKRGRYRCRKPICKPGGCQDRRRCRKPRRKSG